MPKPKSIISKTLKADPIIVEKPKLEPTETGGGNPFRRERANTLSKPKFDINSFTAFIMTGEMPQDAESTKETQFLPPKSNKPGKRVTFDTGPPQVAEAAARSMEELLRQSNSMPQLVPANRQLPMQSFQQPGQANYNVGSVFNSSALSNPPMQPLVSQDTGTDPVDDADIETDTFKNVNIDSVLHNGVSNVPPPIPRHRASSLLSAYDDSPSPSPPVNMNNQFAQAPAPPLPPKVRVEAVNGSVGPYSSGTFANGSPNGSVPHSPLPQHPTGPTLAALVPTPTGPVIGRSNSSTNIFGSMNNQMSNNIQQNSIHNNSSNTSQNHGNTNHNNLNGAAAFGTNQGQPPTSFGLSPQPTGLMNHSPYGLSPQPTGPINNGGVSGTEPPPVPPARNAFGQFLQPNNTGRGAGNSPSPSLSQFESIFQKPTAGVHQAGVHQAQQMQQGHSMSPMNGSNTQLPNTTFDHRGGLPTLAFGHTQESQQHLFPVATGGGMPMTNNNPSFQNIPPPPPRRAVSGGSGPAGPLQSNPTGINNMTGQQFLSPNATGMRTASAGSVTSNSSMTSNGPVMNNGMLAPPPPPSRRRLLSLSTGGQNPMPFQQMHSSSASNLPTNVGPPGGFQQQFPGHQPLYSTPAASNSVPNLSNSMQNLGLR